MMAPHTRLTNRIVGALNSPRVRDISAVSWFPILSVITSIAVTIVKGT